MYADTITGSIKKAVDETSRRREKQIEFNKKHNITPKSIKKAITDGIEKLHESEEITIKAAGETEDAHQLNELISELQHEMEVAARNLQFEKAAYFRDQIKTLRGK